MVLKRKKSIGSQDGAVDFKTIVAKSKRSIERRITRLRMKMQDTPRDGPHVKNEENSSESSSSSSSDLDLDDDSNCSDYANLPSRLEEMREKVSSDCDEIITDNIEIIFEDELDMENKNNDVQEDFPMDNDEQKQINVADISLASNANLFTKREPYLSVTAHNFNADMDITKVSKLRSAKGGELLCIDGYIYHAKNVQNSCTYWTCIKTKDRVLKCGSRVGTVMTDNGIKVSKVSSHHTHPVNEYDIKRRLYNEFVANGYSKSDLKPKEILKRPIEELSEEYAEMIANSKVTTRHYLPLLNKYTKGFSSTMKLYAVSDGPPSLAVRMTLKALKIPYELVDVDYCAAEHMSEEYAKMNPQKEIPVLDDDGFFLSESIAIMQYLCDKYAPNTNIYPTEAKQRAIVNHRLCFNMGFYYPTISAHAMAPIFFDYPRNEMSLKKVNNALSVFQTYLQRSGTKYAAGQQVTIADFAIMSGTLCLEAIGFDFSPYPLVKKWYENFKLEYPDLWEIGNGGMKVIAHFEKNPPDLSHMNHPFHPARKIKS